MSRLHNYRSPLGKSDGPCLNCDKRQMGCHSTCNTYIEWKKKRQEELDKRQAENELNKAIIDITYRTHLAIKKHTHKRK